MEEARTLSSDQAWSIASSISAALTANGLAASIAIVSRDGQPLCQVTMDGARPFTAHVALLKAQQAAQIGCRTRRTAEQAAKGEITPEVLGMDPRTFIHWPGGVPVYTKQRALLGGVGVSNLTGDEDEKFAIAGVEDRGFVSDK